MSSAVIVIGIDPDCDKHGAAVYIDGRLSGLYNWSTIEILDYSASQPLLDLMLVIEDVKVSSFAYGAKNPRIAKARSPTAAAHAMGVSLGKNQQSQIELQRWLDHYDIKYINIKPTAGNWAETKNKAQFEKVTGWAGRSNADNRSAAFFGWLGLERVKLKVPYDDNQKDD